MRSDFCVVFTMTLCAPQLKQTLISLLFQVIRLLDYIDRRSYLKLTCEYEFHQNLMSQRIMVRATSRSDHPWSAIFNVIVYSAMKHEHTLQDC